MVPLWLLLRDVERGGARAWRSWDEAGWGACAESFAGWRGTASGLADPGGWRESTRDALGDVAREGSGGGLLPASALVELVRGFVFSETGGREGRMLGRR